MTDWDSLDCNLSEATLTSLNKLNFTKPTPIQLHAIPKFLSKKDIIAQAVTGSGKTLAFIIPIIELLNQSTDVKKSDIFGLILTPTSELASQTYDMFTEFLEHFTDKKPIVKIFKEFSKNKKNTKDDRFLYFRKQTMLSSNDGGKEESSVILSGEMAESEYGTVLISTPGALGRFIDTYGANNDLIRRVKALEVLVMDEADRLLDMGFEAELSTILQVLPKQRVTCLFSATQTARVTDLVKAGLRNPFKVSIKVNTGDDTENKSVIPANLDNYYSVIKHEQKFQYLVDFIANNSSQKILVFMATCCSVDYFYRVTKLLYPKLTLFALHKKVKSRRQQIFSEFKSKKPTNDKAVVMFCTDLMARGIDMPDIDWVVQYDPPKQSANFVHRIGRTARFEKSGKTLIFLRKCEEPFIDFLAKSHEVEIEQYKNDKTWDLPSTRKCMGDKMKDLCIKDRLLYEKSINAFTSYIQFYKKHELHLLFRLKFLNIGQLANSFGLLRIPKMDDIRNLDTSEFKERAIDLKDLVYKDKSVRKVREKTLLIKQQRKLEKAEEKVEEIEANKQKIKYTNNQKKFDPTNQKTTYEKKPTHNKKMDRKRKLDNQKTESEKSKEPFAKKAKVDVKPGFKDSKKFVKSDNKNVKIDKEVTKVDKKAAKVDKEVTQVDKKVAKVDKKAAKVNKKVAKVDKENDKKEKKTVKKDKPQVNIEKIVRTGILG